MKRKDLYKGLISDLLNKYSHALNREARKDVEDYLDSEEFVQALTGIINAPLADSLIPLASTCKHMIEQCIDLEEDIPPKRYEIHLLTTRQNPKHSRNIKYISSALCVIDMPQLYISADKKYEEGLWLLLEQIFIDDKRRKKLLSELVNKNQSDTFILCYQKTRLGITNKINNEELYSFALLSLINEKKIIAIPEGLQFAWSNTPFIAPLNYDRNIVYQEYYDIYDVFNDWLHAKDILTAFLRMYQIAEYMIYRSQMVEIIGRGNIKQSFLRETKSLSDKYKNGERNTIIKNFPMLFNNFSLVPAQVTTAWRFINTYFDTTSTGSNYLVYTGNQNDIDRGVAKFVYDVRCSIVHNKESEFHILYNNYEEYQTIVPLLYSINEQMATKIINIINQPGTCIHYPDKELKLY